jgi:hypothetical protein
MIIAFDPGKKEWNYALMPSLEGPDVVEAGKLHGSVVKYTDDNVRSFINQVDELILSQYPIDTIIIEASM